MEILEGIKKIECLTPLPDSANKMQELFNYPTVDLHDMAEVISIDPAITLSLLNYANNFFKSFEKIDSIDKACTFLGAENIQKALINSFPNAHIRSYSPYEGFIWEHAIASAYLSRIIAQEIDEEMGEIAYTAGLIHDFGEMILAQYFPEHFSKIVKKVMKNKISFLEAEKSLFNTTHIEIGRKVAEYWGLPLSLIDVIAFHHNPSESCYNSKLVSIVVFADVVCNRLGIGFGINSCHNSIKHDILKITEIDDRKKENIVFSLQEILNENESLRADWMDIN
ncbi:HDOD domain-containing protein [Candidatus Desantisbacteria bacterium]|nr:HDOD domain-containing protein [Candidatus Desantisbacteria bacterium]